MQVSKTFYKLFLLSKYSEDRTAKDKMRILLPKYLASTKVLTPKREVAIEMALLGKPLPWRHRRVNNYLLGQDWILREFLRSTYKPIPTTKEGSRVFNMEMDSELKTLSREVEKIRQDIISGLSPDALKKAKTEGLI